MWVKHTIQERKLRETNKRRGYGVGKEHDSVNRGTNVKSII